ncbi:small subunit ribosomal protein S9 [Mycobacterium sp. AZCC_0083]|nr:small subunit ribosomal protein S9 [Mycobacterium sp. AZCC_0083]
MTEPNDTTEPNDATEPTDVTNGASVATGETEVVETEAPEAPEVEAVETPAVETPAVETAAVETAAPETEAVVESAPREPIVIERPIQTVGRRKEAVVRVRLTPGTGKFTLDGRSLEQYFPNKVHQQLIKAPLVLVDRLDTVDIFAHLDGGGPSGQAGALRLAIARALIIVQPEDRPPLKKAGFLTRDPRAIERKKYGLKKARKAPQYSKR